MGRRRRPWPARLRGAVRATLAFLLGNVGVVVLVAGYTIVGAFMFQAIEGASEMERVSLMARERDNTVQYLWHNVTLVINPLNETDIKHRVGAVVLSYQRLVVVAARRGWDGGRSSRQWSFSNAFLYSMTVITTIGYGHLSPRTSWGKVCTIGYALLGMPLFLLYLSNVGSLLARWFKCVYSLLCLFRGCPGFRRRRVQAIKHQLEISETESVERPTKRRWYSDAEASQYNLPHGYKSCKPRHMPYGDTQYSLRAGYEPTDRKMSLNTRYRAPYKQWEHRVVNFRDDRHSLRLHKDRSYPPDFRDRRQNDLRRVPLDNGLYLEKPPRLREHTRAAERYERYSKPLEIVDSKYVPHPYTHVPRSPEYRSSSAPHCSLTSPALVPPPGGRGWSAPPRPSSVSSDFSYVTFDAQSITVPISVCVGIMVGYLVFGSMIFGLWEQWDLLDGAYFCFISLTSIGFGDFVPGERVYTPRIETSFVVCSLYLMLGMALVAMCFNLMQEQVIHYFAGLRRVFRRICRCQCTRRRLV